MKRVCRLVIVLVSTLILPPAGGPWPTWAAAATAQESSARLREQPVSTALEPGRHHVVQTWSQETDYPRPYFVHVPKVEATAAAQDNAPANAAKPPTPRETDDSPRWPVLIFLHGNGGSGLKSMKGMTWRLKATAQQYIMVFPDGYQKSWNIVSERSQADDLAFVEAIVTRLQNCSNVRGDDITIMGSSNGAALVNQLAIESRLPQIRTLISCVSPLNAWQYQDGQFRQRGPQSNYEQAVRPVTGRRLLNVSGTEDRLVPYAGGPSATIRAKDGRLAFLPAEQSTYLWARHFGETGPQRTAPSFTEGPLQFYSYLDGDVVHIKVNEEGHGATRVVDDRLLLRFLRGHLGSSEDGR